MKAYKNTCRESIGVRETVDMCRAAGRRGDVYGDFMSFRFGGAERDAYFCGKDHRKRRRMSVCVRTAKR